MIKNIHNYGTSKVFSWNSNYLFQVLTSGKKPPITNPKVALAFRKFDRGDFVPVRLKEVAYQDIDLDIGYGEKFTRPTVLGQMASLLNLRAGGNYLDLGSGSGYMACIMGFIAGAGGKVYSLERIQWVWEFARSNAMKYRELTENISFLYRDGKEGLPIYAPYDGIHVAFALDSISETLKMQLSNGGKMVVPTVNNDIRLITRIDQESYEEEVIPGFVFDEVKDGIG